MIDIHDTIKAKFWLSDFHDFNLMTYVDSLYKKFMVWLHVSSIPG